MASKQKVDLDDFIILPEERKKVVQVPTFARDELGKVIYTAYDKKRKEEFDNNQNLKLQYVNGEIIGGNIFDAALLNELVSPKLRVAGTRDLGNARVLEMAKDEHYIGALALVLRSTKDSWNEKNNGLAEQLAEYVELSQGPALLTGLKVVPWKEDKHYRMQFVPSNGKQFGVHYDDRLLGKYNGWKFNEVDSNGLPVGLVKERGSRTWYTRVDGLSGFILGRSLDLGSTYYGLALSGKAGRVVFFSGEASAKI